MKTKNNVLKHALTGTREWADKNINIAYGCENNCKYCYSKAMALRSKRIEATAWVNPWPNFIEINKKIKKHDKPIMFPSSHDITPLTLNVSIKVIEKHLLIGNSLLIVSKPNYDCIKQICDTFEDFKNQILFRFSIGSHSDLTLSFWEPNAPILEDRLKALRYAFSKGFQTSVSCEPMLDCQPEKVVSLVRPYVTESIWLGKPNSFKSILSINQHTDRRTQIMADALIAQQDEKFINQLFQKYKSDPLIKWKDSINKVVGLQSVVYSE